ncbi:hypothetical protein Pmani_002545 [Petrolisthes manimaculis]|uniref:Uncharacterized protein n=1 Tax=Petrolisthes manimaculis TaxID=1843537 RepID=A0AAE1QHP7_9EUCA|nr:hypothetical protein Pmani_002545 [Petrolisthes manimaculis]
MLFRKGIKHPERVMNTSKSSVSLMVACSAAGNQLPPYVVYKAERLMDTWLLDEMDNMDELAVATGIYPIDKDHIMRKITNENVKSAHDLVSPLVLEHLRQIRESAANNPNATRRGKCVQVSPGKSISLQELGASTSGTSVSRPAKRCASGGRGGRRCKVAKIPVPADFPLSSDSDENADDPCEVTVGEDSSDNSNDGGLEVPVGGNKHEQESHGDTSDSDTWNIEEVSVENHEVEELPEDAFEVGDYVWPNCPKVRCKWAPHI